MRGSHVQLGEAGAFSPGDRNLFELHIQGTRDDPRIVFPTWDSANIEDGYEGGVLPIGEGGDLSISDVMVISEVPGLSDLIHVRGTRVIKSVNDIRDLLDVMVKSQHAESGCD